MDRISTLAEQRAIRAKCFHPTGTFVEFKEEDIDQSIPERFEQIVAKYRERVAVKTSNRTLTYDELNHFANCVAYVILERCGKENEPIALLMEQGASLIAAMIGILKAGKTYVPLDPYYPQARLGSILQDSQPSLIVTNNSNLSLALQLVPEAFRINNIDEIDSRPFDRDLNRLTFSDSLAWIIFTSGSTGKPKGVMQTHRNVLHETMNYTNGAHIGYEDRLVLVSSPAFADAVRTTYAALLNGASLYPLDIKKEGITALANHLIQQEITVYRSVPSLFRQLASALSEEKAVPKLRLIYLAGDSVSKTDVELYKTHFPRNCILVNGLGSTESLTFRWYFMDKETPCTSNGMPVGYEVQDKPVLLINDAGEAVGPKYIGETAVKSRYLSPGYWRRNDLTKTAFLPDPQGGEERIYRTGDLGYLRQGGCLEHRGRKDFQVKLRGHRIELTEIEIALLALGNIKEAVVHGRADQYEEKCLVAYLIPAEKTRPTVTTIRHALRKNLPDYMIPSSFVFLDALPLSPNGKVDRLALPDPGQSRPDLDAPYVTPTTPIEQEVAKIWGEVLSLDQVGIHDNFFDLGGHSLAATRVISRVIKGFGLELPLQSLFAAPTVAEMTVVITEHQGKKLGEEKLDRILAELETISDEEAQRLFANQPVAERR